MHYINATALFFPILREHCAIHFLQCNSNKKHKPHYRHEVLNI